MAAYPLTDGLPWVAGTIAMGGIMFWVGGIITMGGIIFSP